MKRAKQIGALPLRWDRGKLRILLVTSRGTKRWVVPKGWEMKGVKPWRAAEIEALEEAGIVGKIRKKPVGRYRYRKAMPRGNAIRCQVTLYPLLVTAQKNRWKEASQRKRQWFSLKKAAKRVQEADLADLLRDLGSRAMDARALDRLLKA